MAIVMADVCADFCRYSRYICFLYNDILTTVDYGGGGYHLLSKMIDYVVLIWTAPYPNNHLTCKTFEKKQRKKLKKTFLVKNNDKSLPIKNPLIGEKIPLIESWTMHFMWMELEKKYYILTVKNN